jgi:hypothetical protein
MEKRFAAKRFNFFTGMVLLLITFFIFLDIYLIIGGMGAQPLKRIFMLEGLVICTLTVILLITLSEKIIINEHSIRQTSFHIPGITVAEIAMPWGEVSEVKGEFGLFHIGEKITLRSSGNQSTITDSILERRTMAITNTMENFEEIVREVVTRAENAQLDENLKKFTVV